MVFPDSKISVTDNFTLVYGAELHYLEAGDGPLLILLHGLVGSAKQWGETIEQLAEHFYVIALDQIGFGYSQKPLLNYCLGTLVDFLYGFCQALNIEQVSLVGQDLGGTVATALAIGHRSLVKQLVLVNSTLSWENSALLELATCATRKQTWQLLQHLYYHKDRFVNEKEVDKLFAQKAIANDGYTIQQLSASLHRSENMPSARCCELTVPTLLIHSRHNELISLASSQQLLDQIRGSQLKILDSCGHFPHVEQPETFSKTVLEFLSAPSYQ